MPLIGIHPNPWLDFEYGETVNQIQRLPNSEDGEFIYLFIYFNLQSANINHKTLLVTFFKQKETVRGCDEHQVKKFGLRTREIELQDHDMKKACIGVTFKIQGLKFNFESNTHTGGYEKVDFYFSSRQ